MGNKILLRPDSADFVVELDRLAAWKEHRKDEDEPGSDQQLEQSAPRQPLRTGNVLQRGLEFFRQHSHRVRQIM